MAVTCTKKLKHRFFSGDTAWTIEQGSVLDRDYLDRLGLFDIVYSWGVLHHTGNLAEALVLAAGRVRQCGIPCLAIYNDQGGASRRWHAVKRLYSRLPTSLRTLLVRGIATLFESNFALVRLAQGKSPLPMADWRQKGMERGVSAWHRWVDWCGGLPFEVAWPEEVVVPLHKLGFYLKNLATCGGGWGCNQYVFSKGDQS